MPDFASLCSRLATRYPRLYAWAPRQAERARRLERKLRPGPRAWRGAAFGVAGVTAFVLLQVVFYLGFRPTPTAGKLLVVGGLLLSSLASGLGLLFAAWALRKLPRPYRWTLALGLGVLVPLLGRFGNATMVVAYVVVAGSLLGAGLGVIANGGTRDLRPLRKGVAVAGFFVGAAALLTALLFLYSDGLDAIEARNAAAEATATQALAIADPSAPGDLEVGTLTYGNGSDHRPEFGRNAELLTEPVDGSDFVSNWEGRSGWARTRFWGFDVKELPLQGRVWYPHGEGPFPLLLAVHGNHGMEDYSDPGYAYLGELFASRGFVFVSVDENFINGSAGDRLSGGLREENDARGWLLLEHLRQWREWSVEPGHRLQGLVDMDRVGLIGHSRGGEAVAVAAAFNDLPYYPDDATVPFDYGFGLRAVIAIAPIYGQYRPAGLLTPLRDVNYLSIHGAHDGDVSSFAGSAQYERATFSGDSYHFKSTVYVLGANHGQFNSVWGNTDTGEPFARLLNLRALMPGEDQRQIARVFLSAFVEAAIRDRQEYLPLFAQPSRGSEWLPDTVYVTDFQDSASRFVATFDEDLDVTTTTLAGGATRAEGVTRWREDRISLKWRTKETNGVYVGWKNEPDGDTETDADNPPRYVITLPEEFAVAASETLFFSAADADESPEPKDDDDTNNNEVENAEEEEEDEDEENEDEDAPRPPIDFTVRLVDAAGNTASVPLSRFSFVQPQLQVQTYKGVFEAAERSSEAIFQVFELPLAWFLEAEPALQPGALRSIEFVFDRTAAAVLVFDNLGFR